MDKYIIYKDTRCDDGQIQNLDQHINAVAASQRPDKVQAYKYSKQWLGNLGDYATPAHQYL